VTRLLYRGYRSKVGSSSDFALYVIRTLQTHRQQILLEKISVKDGSINNQVIVWKIGLNLCFDIQHIFLQNMNAIVLNSSKILPWISR
jgi:hypothetical protein